MLSRKTKRTIITFFAEKSIVFKPLVIKRLYNLSTKKRKQKVEEAFNKYYKGNYTNKEKRNIKRDVVYCKVHYKTTYQEYFLYNFIEKSHKQRKNFIANIERKKYLRLLGNVEGYDILGDKYLSYLKLKKFYRREVIKISKEKDIDKFYEYVKKHPVFVIKPLDSSFGKGVELIDSSKYANKKTLFKDLLKNGQFIMEEQILQNKKLSSLHPSSLNTIRMVTYLDPKGKVTVHCPFIKIGQKGSFVDNGGAGGILALIDAKTGQIITEGKDENNNKYKNHPDTNIELKGFQIPYWEEGLEYAEKVAKAFPDTKYIGWDFALSEQNKWTIVEGNSRTQFFGQQMTDELGKKKDLEKLINYKKLKKKRKQNDKMWGEIKI